MISDYLIGSLTLPMSRAHEYTGGNIIRRHQLTKLNADGKEQFSGYLWLTVKHTSNLEEVWSWCHPFALSRQHVQMRHEVSFVFVFQATINCVQRDLLQK